MGTTALTEAVFYILLSLDTPRHGYGIMQNVERLSGGRVRLAAGTLYGALTTLTERGWIEAVGYGYDGTPSASDRLETADSPAALRLTLHTAPGGHAADGADIAYVDIAVQDSAGRVCPLCDARIDFTLAGPAQFLGGNTSGRFAGYGHDDSVIHQNHVYAECGTNRVFLRAGTAPGTIRLTAVMGSLRNVITLQSKPADLAPLTAAPLPCRLPDYAACAPQHRDAFVPIPQAEAAKYQPEDECFF